MKKYVFSLANTLLAAVLLIYCCLPSVYASSYSDVADSDWHAEAIEYVKEISLMEGVGNGNFQPNLLLTRAQVVAILYRLEGEPETQYIGKFQDVSADAWYSLPISWAYQKEVVHGTSESTFSPSASITREQLAVIIDNYMTMKDIKLEMAENAFYHVKDCWTVSFYAGHQVARVCEAGLMNPDQQYNFNPRGNVTRADAAVVFMRLNKAMAGEKLSGLLTPNTKIDLSKLSQKEKDAQTLAIAQKIASVIPADRDAPERIAMAAHIVSHYCRFCQYTMSGPNYSTAYGVFIKGEYSCAGSTRALGLVLTCMGYEWKHMNENLYSHQWCELNINSRTLIADGQTGEVGYKNGNSIEEYVSNPFVGFVDPWPYTLQ